MAKFELVIAGGGLTAARAIKSYREAGGGGRVALLSEEATLPYHRPALSKRFLRGETTATPTSRTTPSTAATTSRSCSAGESRASTPRRAC